MAPTAPLHAFEALRQSQLARLLGLGLLVLLLQVPIGMVEGVILERRQTRNEAIHEVTQKWGGRQQVAGPRLVVPFRTAPTASTEGSAWSRRRFTGVAHFLPEQLEISGGVETEMRRRGIFEVPVYRADLTLAGHFSEPDFSDWGAGPVEPAWEDAYLLLELCEPRALQNPLRVDWNQETLDFEPDGENAIRVPLGALARADERRFRIPLALRGSDALSFTPVGRDTRVELHADWPSPSFQGVWLPVSHDVTREGFRARWQVPSFGRGFPQRFLASEGVAKSLATTTAGVTLLTPVDPYRMAQRSVKYAKLFLALTFASLWLFECLAGVRIHAIQYLLVGAAMCLFYLLELSLAEHVGFGASYALASAGVVALVASYCASVLGRTGRAASIGAVLVALYGYLYVLLTNEDYALLSGSLALFAALALVMFLTRRVDWTALPGRVARSA